MIEVGRISRFAFIVCLLSEFLLFLTTTEAPTSAQRLSRQQIETSLSQIVQIPTGSITVGAVLSALSKQTGITIQAQDGLQTRVIVARMKGLSAAQTLDVLTDLHGWRWFVSEQGSLWIARKRVDMPHNVNELTSALQSVLPNDFKRYLGMIPLMSNNILPAVREKNTFSLLAYPMQQDVKTSNLQSFSNSASGKIYHLLPLQQKSVAADILPMFTPGKSLFYSSLTPDQQNSLVGVVVLQNVSQLDPNGFEMLDRFKHPLLFDIPQLDLKLVGADTLQIGKTTTEIVRGQLIEHFFGGAALVNPRFSTNAPVSP